jgi:SAM-dependent methyltransferase
VLSDMFYRAFEEKYRGSREIIKSRLRVYLPFIEPVLKAYPQGQALDLGCGRGEWLELLTEQGFVAKGVDLDEGMLQACREKGLHVETADAVAAMQALPAGSLCLVSGFHIAEHLPFHVLQQLVIEAKRVLAPGGLLILETPNPENIAVGTNSFYLDPTHERPIPPALLSFLPEHYGYQRSKVLRLQESAQLHSESAPRLMHVLDGVSPDYAVVAQTEGLPWLTEALTPVFEQNYGLTLHTLAERYQQTLDQRLRLIEEKAQQAEDKAQQAEDKAQQAEVASHHYATQLRAVYDSTSWRITAPLRWPVLQWRLLRQYGVKTRAKALARRVLRKLALFLMVRPNLKDRAKRVVYRLGLAKRLEPLLRSVVLSQPISSSSPSLDAASTSQVLTLTDLSPRSRQIYAELKAAIAEQQKGGH